MAKNSILSDKLIFDNRALRVLPIDPITSNYVRTVNGSCFSVVKPDPVKNPKLVACSNSALKLLGLHKFSDKEHINDLTEYLCGNRLFKGSEPAAHCYCGHQFGNFAGQLGDGAAMYLGEVINKEGERWEMQLKGSGKTPFSRTADGRKVLRSSLREFLCSEAMHFLNIPTTRAGSCVTSDTLIERDVFYDGHPIMERCSVVLRISPTFIRFGSFEICKTLDLSTQRHGPSYDKPEILKILLDYVVETFYPEIWTQRNSKDMSECYMGFFREIVRLTAVMVAKWQCIGFCHGVLNTDNMSIIGITIDYGPFGFMDRYDPNFICNASDTAGRYSFENQPSICKWNCLKLSESLKDLIPLETSRNIIETTFDKTYKNEYFQQMFSKIGLNYVENKKENEELLQNLLDTMYNTGADYTNTFLVLEKIVEEFGKNSKIDDQILLTQTASIEEMKNAFKCSISKENRDFFWRMAKNDKNILLAMGGEFIIYEEEKEKKLEKIKDWTNDEKKSHDLKLWKEWLDKYFIILRSYWKTFPNSNEGCENSLQKMRENNPRIVLRNYLAELAIKAAEKNDFSETQKLLEKLQNPFSDDVIEKKLVGETSDSKISICERPPNWAYDIKVT